MCQISINSYTGRQTLTVHGIGRFDKCQPNRLHLNHSRFTILTEDEEEEEKNTHYSLANRLIFSALDSQIHIRSRIKCTDFWFADF